VFLLGEFLLQFSSPISRRWGISWTGEGGNPPGRGKKEIFPLENLCVGLAGSAHSRLDGRRGGHFFPARCSDATVHQETERERERGGRREEGEGRWKRQVECRYYAELEGAEPERGMKLLPRETAVVSSLSIPSVDPPPPPPPRFLSFFSPFSEQGLGGVSV